MNPVARYFLARLALFAGLAVPLSFMMNFLLALLVALLASMMLSFLLLKGMRTAMVDHIDERMRQRKEEKDRLRAELAGEPAEADQP